MDASQVSTVGQTQTFDRNRNNSHYVQTACCGAVHQRIWQWCVLPVVIYDYNQVDQSVTP